MPAFILSGAEASDEALEAAHSVTKKSRLKPPSQKPSMRKTMHKCEHPGCGETFRSSRNLAKHVLASHSKSRDPPNEQWPGIEPLRSTTLVGVNSAMLAGLSSAILASLASSIPAHATELPESKPTLLFMIDDSVLLDPPEKSKWMWANFERTLYRCADTLSSCVPVIEFQFLQSRVSFCVTEGERAETWGRPCITVKDLPQKLKGVYERPHVDDPNRVPSSHLFLRLEYVLSRRWSYDLDLPGVVFFTDRTLNDTGISNLNKYLLNRLSPELRAIKRDIVRVPVLQFVILNNRLNTTSWKRSITSCLGFSSNVGYVEYWKVHH